MREALEGESLKAKIRQFVRGASKISADHIRNEAKARLRRQLIHPTGVTEASIVVKSDKSGWGWVVTTERDPFAALPRWIEFGTKQGKPGSHASAPRPFFFDSARLEERAHRERVSAAIGSALGEYGLGEGQVAAVDRPMSPGGTGLL